MSTSFATAAEGDKGWQLSSTVRACEAEGRREGHEYGRAVARAATWARVLRRQARRRFGRDEAAGVALLEALERGHDLDALARLGERILTADTWESWLAGVVAPPPAPDIPDYARNLPIDIEPSRPSVDTLMRVGLKGGGDTLLLLRLQKWYQPDLDRLQFAEAMRLERRHGQRPTIAVVLLWPSADGPNITGSHRGKDRRGRPITFEYTIKRAWELDPDEAFVGVGTLMLAPLAKGARDRMPELVARIDRMLNDRKADAKTRDAAWMTTYWCMGMVCCLEEAHAALGHRLEMIRRIKDFRTAKGQAFQETFEEAGKVEPLAALRELILRQGTARFGPHAAAEAALAAVDRLDRLEEAASQALAVADWDALLGLAAASTSAG